MIRSISNPWRLLILLIVPLLFLWLISLREVRLKIVDYYCNQKQFWQAVNWYGKVARQDRVRVNRGKANVLKNAETLGKLNSSIFQLIQEKLFIVIQLLGLPQTEDLKSFIADPRLFLKDIDELFGTYPKEKLQKAKNELQSLNNVSYYMSLFDKEHGKVQIGHIVPVINFLNRIANEAEHHLKFSALATNKTDDYGQKTSPSLNGTQRKNTASHRKAEVISPSRKLNIEIDKGISAIGCDFLNDKNEIITDRVPTFKRGDAFFYATYYKMDSSPQQNWIVVENYYIIPVAKIVLLGAYFDGIRLPALITQIQPLEEGIYRQTYMIKIPRYALPGKYEILLKKEKSPIPFDMIKSKNNKQYIEVKIPLQETRQESRGDPLSIPANEFLLNPAFSSNIEIILLWTGDIVGYITAAYPIFEKIIVRAKGDQALGEFPLLKMFINEEEIGEVFVNKEWRDYKFKITHQKGPMRVRIRFDNDYAAPGQDRNMYVESIKLLH